MKYEVIIGIEIHLQLRTKTKAFCACENEFGGEPNTRVCPVCMGLPGTLPVANFSMVESAIVGGLALNCEIAGITKFDRKNYVYPDLPKGYQISQFDMPICVNGYLDIEDTDKQTKRIRIKRLHMEEDAGKNIHPENGGDISLVDFNRCGTPLLEIVSEPDIRSAEGAVAYVQAVREIMQYLEISDCNMEEGSLRCDANINLWIDEDGETFATPIAEVKNMNSFRSIKNAMEFEEKRQIKEWAETRVTLQEAGKTTRGYTDASGETKLMRSKEESSDYRYFPEPDLKPISIDGSYIAELQKRVGERPAEKRSRFMSEYGLSEQDSRNFCSSKELCDFFEQAASGYEYPKKVASWILSEVKKYLNAHSIDIAGLSISPDRVRELLDLVDDGTISNRIAKDVFEEMAERGMSAAQVIAEKGLSQIAEEGELEAIVDKVLADDPSSVDDFKNGKKKVIGFLMGQIMKETRGKANPQKAMELLQKKLKNGP